MSGNSSASGYPPEDEPLKTDEELIKILTNARAAERLPIETQLRLNHTLEAARDPFGRTNVERREWERKNSAGGGGGGGGGGAGGGFKPVPFKPNRSQAEIDLLNNRSPVRPPLQTIYYPPPPPPPPAAPVTVAAPAPVTTTGTAAAAATGTAAATEPLFRRKGAAAQREEPDNTAVQQRDPRTRKSFCEKLGDCSIQGGSRKSRKSRKGRKASKKSRKVSRRAKKSKKSNRATRKH